VFGVIVDKLARAAGKLRPRLRLRPAATVVKINVGAGLCAAPGWLHVEGSIHGLFAGAPALLLAVLHRLSSHVRQQMPRPAYVQTLQQHDYIFYDLDRGLPFDDNVADYIYSSHVLEHFYQSDADRLIGEMFRVLKTGGMVRVCVPDLAIAVGLYLEGRKHEALEYFFVTERGNSMATHYYMYDFDLLAALLLKHGFSSITRRQYREGATPDLELLDNRPEQTLYVEALKT
jgi:SAM-dependent methyltransferase